ncbi:preprotein translocase subunit SecE [Neisseria wadsworthii]|uniref:Protein translocase subunit SecE n=1 Tax=Neisseria wadsworthii 9715 TaxID=1030841 RepID=G4CTH3_9NEIS|nr:preprotein translocase subunit SecE [Neisseria wadsworthii]EGZ44218.1 preprotein translocase [Neisseria wadsworthii 9715]QMT35957.1 preprotein translocase subunit SecE [Neisseria wadsworthii]
MTEKTPSESYSSEKGINQWDKKNNSATKKIGVADYVKSVVAFSVFGLGLWVYYTNILNISLYLRYVILALSGLIVVVLILSWCQYGRDFLLYVKDSYAEFKKVVWPTRAESTRITIRVIMFALILSAFIYAVDSLITVVFNAVLLKG